MANLNAILTTWQEWQLGLSETPVVVSALPQGLTNKSFVISSSGKQWVLRLNAQNSSVLGIHREYEAAILAATSQSGLSPINYYANLTPGFMVSEYLPEWLPVRSTPDWLAIMASVLKRVHGLAVPDVPAVDYVTYSEQYIDRLRSAYGVVPKSILALRGQELPFLTRFQNELNEPRLCHHDPARNHWRLQQGIPCLIDWEYAALRDPACDLYMLCDSWQLNASEQRQLLAYYGDDVSEQRLRDAKRVCRYIDALWSEIQKIPVLGSLI